MVTPFPFRHQVRSRTRSGGKDAHKNAAGDRRSEKLIVGRKQEKLELDMRVHGIQGRADGRVDQGESSQVKSSQVKV